MASPESTSTKQPSSKEPSSKEPSSKESSSKESSSKESSSGGVPLTATSSQGKRVSIKGLSNYQDVIQVLVGKNDNQKTFLIHQHLVTTRSPFFKAALSGAWKESKDRLVKLPEDDPKIFEIYIHFLYTGQLAVIPDPLPENYKGDDENAILAQVYVLAEKLQDVDSKNAALEVLVLNSCQIHPKYGRVAPGLKVCRIIYRGTPVSSPMRKLLVDIYTSRATKSWFTNVRKKHWPDEFIHELLVNVLDERAWPGDPVKKIDTSKYLESNDNQNP